MQRYGPLIMAMFAMVLFLGSAGNVSASNLVISGSTISNTYVPAETGDAGVSVEPTEMHATCAFYGNATAANVLHNGYVYEEYLGAGVDVVRSLN